MRARTRLSTTETTVRETTRDDARRDATVRPVARVLLSTRAPPARVVVDRPTDRPTATTFGAVGSFRVLLVLCVREYDSKQRTRARE